MVLASREGQKDLELNSEQPDQGGQVHSIRVIPPRVN